jgi:hypothetical protein
MLAAMEVPIMPTRTAREMEALMKPEDSIMEIGALGKRIRGSKLRIKAVMTVCLQIVTLCIVQKGCFLECCSVQFVTMEAQSRKSTLGLAPLFAERFVYTPPAACLCTQLCMIVRGWHSF